MWGQVVGPPERSWGTVPVSPARLADLRRMVPRIGTLGEHERFLLREVLSFGPRLGNSSGFLIVELLALTSFDQPVSTSLFLIFFSPL